MKNRLAPCVERFEKPLFKKLNKKRLRESEGGALFERTPEASEMA